MKNIDPVKSGHTDGLKPPKITISDSPVNKQISLLDRSSDRKPRRILRLLLTLIILAILGLGLVVFFRASDLSNKIFVGQKTTFFQKIKDIFRGGSGNVKLVGEDLGQINILLLGIGGEGHDGPYLTDTMMLAQIRPDTGQISLISIPRDYLVSLPENSGQQKINAAFALGYTKHHDWNEGGQWAEQVVENISGLKIPYFAVVDFAGFEEAINQVGGVDVNVERTFTDYTYPDSHSGYLPPITFSQGWQHMDGTKALQFARSRHAPGPEGSDFARSQRQQKIIEAFKEKAINLNLITDSGKINNLLSIFANHFHTNISPGELYRVYQLVKERNLSSTLSLSLDPSTHLICPQILPENGAYVLEPCEGKTAGDVKNFFKNSFTLGKIYSEKSVVWMANSTTDKTAYTRADNQLKDTGLTLWEVPYNLQALPQTIFYQANPKPATAEFLKNTLNATEVTLPPPGFKVDKSKVDIIVILGGSK